MSECDEMSQYFNGLVTFNKKLCTTSNLAKFWIGFLDMIELLFNLVYSTRSGNWNIYIESVRIALPWFFAYDRTNYSRYLTVYCQDLLSLEKEFWEVNAEFERGNFSVQVSNINSFEKKSLKQLSIEIREFRWSNW